MRVLFTTQPVLSHFHALVPLALALKGHGHEVAFATGKNFGSVIRDVGFIHFPSGLDFDTNKDVIEILPDKESIAAKFPSMKGIQQLYAFILGLAPVMIGDLEKIASEWKPALLVRDPVEYGGYIVAEKNDLPYVTISWGVYMDPHFYITEAILELRRRYGLYDDAELEKMDQYMVMSFLPPSWPYPNSPVHHVTRRFCSRPFDRSSNEALPEWIGLLPKQPTLLVTLGTVFNRSRETFQAILDGLSSEEVNVIMTVGRTMDPSHFKAPNHIKIVKYIPQTLLLPHCDAILFHGGYNTLHSALWHGLPMVIIPMDGGDQLPNAQFCAELGVAEIIRDLPPQPQVIRDSVRHVLEKSEYRDKTRMLQKEMHNLPDLSDAVRRLEILAKRV